MSGEVHLICGGPRHGEVIRTSCRYVEFPEIVESWRVHYPAPPGTMWPMEYKRHRYEAKTLVTCQGERVRVMAYMGVG